MNEHDRFDCYIIIFAHDREQYLYHIPGVSITLYMLLWKPCDKQTAFTFTQAIARRLYFISVSTIEIFSLLAVTI